MKKTLFLITFFFISLVFSQGISAQQSINVSDEVIELRSEKVEMLHATQRNETILDSVIHYKYTSETDSVRILKRIFEID